MLSGFSLAFLEARVICCYALAADAVPPLFDLDWDVRREGSITAVLVGSLPPVMLSLSSSSVPKILCSDKF